MNTEASMSVLETSEAKISNKRYLLNQIPQRQISFLIQSFAAHPSVIRKGTRKNLHQIFYNKMKDLR